MLFVVPKKQVRSFTQDPPPLQIKPPAPVTVNLTFKDSQFSYVNVARVNSDIFYSLDKTFGFTYGFSVGIELNLSLQICGYRYLGPHVR